MNVEKITAIIADLLKEFDLEEPVHKSFHPGIGPFGEPQLVKEIAKRLTEKGISAQTKRTPDLDIQKKWAVEFKIVRPFGDNAREAENWSVNLLHPYPGNTSLLGDALKLKSLSGFERKCLFMIGFEHNPAKICLDPLIEAFEAIGKRVLKIRLGSRIEQWRDNLVHPEHQVLRCVAWELIS